MRVRKAPWPRKEAIAFSVPWHATGGSTGCHGNTQRLLLFASPLGFRRGRSTVTRTAFPMSSRAPSRTRTSRSRDAISSTRAPTVLPIHCSSTSSFWCVAFRRDISSYHLCFSFTKNNKKNAWILSQHPTRMLFILSFPQFLPHIQLAVADVGADSVDVEGLGPDNLADGFRPRIWGWCTLFISWMCSRNGRNRVNHSIDCIVLHTCSFWGSLMPFK